MAVVQTAYPNTHGLYVAGQVADTTSCRIDSYELTGSTSVLFGYAVQYDGTPPGIQHGASRQRIAQLTASETTSSTDFGIDNEGNPFGEAPAGVHYVIDNEIVYASAASASNLTVVRGQLGSSAAAHSNNDEVYMLNGGLNFLGVAVMDERVKARANDQFETGDIVPVLWSGDIAVPVSAAVTIGAHAVVTLTAATGDAQGSFSARTPGGRHAVIPGAQWITAAADNGIAVMRLTGQQRVTALV